MSELPPVGPLAVRHVNLRVSDMETSKTFYHDALGLMVVRHRPGSPLAFLSSGSGLSFDLALDVRTSKGGEAASPQHTGLDHVAFLCPDRTAFQRAVRRLLAAGVEIDDARDHGFTESIYFHDPDGNGLEVYWERPSEQWPMEADGQLGSRNTAVAVESFLSGDGESDLART